jgi:hypothetical protein
MARQLFVQFLRFDAPNCKENRKNFATTSNKRPHKQPFSVESLLPLTNRRESAAQATV